MYLIYHTFSLTVPTKTRIPNRTRITSGTRNRQTPGTEYQPYSITSIRRRLKGEKLLLLWTIPQIHHQLSSLTRQNTTNLEQNKQFQRPMDKHGKLFIFICEGDVCSYQASLEKSKRKNKVFQGGQARHVSYLEFDWKTRLYYISSFADQSGTSVLSAIAMPVFTLPGHCICN